MGRGRIRKRRRSSINITFQKIDLIKPFKAGRKTKNNQLRNPKMNTLLDNLFLKRFGISVDTNIEDYETGTKKMRGCLCGEYNHMACVLKGKER